jgi:hypothetical protein
MGTRLQIELIPGVLREADQSIADAVATIWKTASQAAAGERLKES